MIRGLIRLSRLGNWACVLLVPVVVFSVLRSVDAQTRFMYLSCQSVHPAFEGWWPNPDGSVTLWFGYMNSNWQEELNSFNGIAKG